MSGMSRVRGWGRCSGPIGCGGYWVGAGWARCIEAEDTRKRRVVALKLVSQQFSGNPVFRARLQREADIAGRLTEPHVVPSTTTARSTGSSMWTCG